MQDSNNCSLEKTIVRDGHQDLGAGLTHFFYSLTNMFSQHIVKAFAGTAKKSKGGTIEGKTYGASTFFSLKPASAVYFNLVGSLKFPLELKEWEGEDNKTFSVAATLNDPVDELHDAYVGAATAVLEHCGVGEHTIVDPYFAGGGDLFRLSLKYGPDGKPKVGEPPVFVSRLHQPIPTDEFAVGDKIKIRLCCDSACAYERDGEEHLKLVFRLVRITNLDNDTPVPDGGDDAESGGAHAAEPEGNGGAGKKKETKEPSKKKLKRSK